MMTIIKDIWYRLKKLNWFVDPETQGEATEEKIREQVQITRVYLVLLISLLLVVILYTSLSKRSISITVPDPLMDIYRQLERKYPLTLSCPCRQISVPYSTLVHFEPEYHQVKHLSILVFFVFSYQCCSLLGC